MADILWNTQEATKACNATPFGNNWECTGISIDSRTVQPGDLFIAIKGPSFDGHKFVKSALKAGAVAALVSKIPADCQGEENLLLVKDCFIGLENLAQASELRSNAKIIAITGSVGKTGVKEALASVLSKQGKTHATIGNLNNHLGLPLTLARMPRDCEYGVLELGMNHSGELTPLSNMAKPDVAVITTIASAHLENFTNVEAIADAKCEIFSGLKENGVAILNADNAFYERMKKAASNHRVLSFGFDERADFQSLDYFETKTGSKVSSNLNGVGVDYTIAHSGRHWVTNSLAVLAGITALGADVNQAARDLAELAPLKGRGAVHTINIQGGNIHVIDESYNANDASMRASLDVLSHQEGRKLAVLGDMLELGAEEIQIHTNIANACEPIDLVFTCGKLMKYLHDALPAHKRGAHASNAKNLAPLVVQVIQPGDVLSIKSSRGSQTNLVLDALLNMQPRGM